MKILYIANIRLPTEKAHGLQIMKTCEAFAGNGVHVELMVPARKNAIVEAPFSYYGVEEQFLITTMPVLDWVRFGRIGVFVSTLLFSEAVRFPQSFRDADLLYSRDAIVLLQYILLHRPFVFEAHAPPTFVSKIVARSARKTIVISGGLRSAYIEAGVPAEKIVVAPDAVDLSLFSDAPDKADARATLGFSKEKVALYAGHLYARKGAHTVAAAAKLLPNVLFVFVGGTAHDVEQFKRDWSDQPNVRIIGHVSHQLVPTYLRAADALILPNSGKDADSARFTSPMKLFEYMGSMTPIVASDVPSVREVLDEGSAAFFSPDDPESLAIALKNVLDDGALSGRIAEGARTRVEAYTWDMRAKKILAALV